MKTTSNSLFLTTLIVAALVLTGPVTHANVPPELDDAAELLINGRLYLNGFPRAKTRNTLRKEYLGVDDGGVAVSQGMFPLLKQAMDAGVTFRAGATPRSIQTDEVAQRLTWEALEAILQGQLIAGNANLLKGLRVAFPDAVGEGEKPGGENVAPVGCPGPGVGLEYRGANVIDLYYAKLHFARGVTAALSFLANDRTGELRAFEALNSFFPQYTYFNTPDLPDPNYDTEQSSQTAAYLLGNLLDRYGKAVVGIGDRLWRAAYFDRARAPGGSRAGERAQMLEAAMREMQKGAHAQYLAALPLAATLDEDEQGYGLCRVDQVRVTAATASSFIDRIRRGEIPKLNSFSLNSSVQNIAQQISLVQSLKDKATTSYGEAESRLWRKKQAEEQVIIDAQALRGSYSRELVEATALNPGSPGDGVYNGLASANDRHRYRADVYAKIERVLDAGINSPELLTSGQLGETVLQMLRAFADLASARNRIDAIPQQIKIEEDRVDAINGVILGTTDQITSYQLAIGIANAHSTSTSVTGGVSSEQGPFFSASVTFTDNPGAITAARFQNKITRAQAIQQVEINNINAAAAIRNLLLQQHQYTLDLESAAAQGQAAVAAVYSLLAGIDRAIENHIYFQESNLGKWYSDPALIFEQEQAEIDYENAVREYVRELYVLSQMLAVRWSEPYENPYLRSDGVPETLGGGLYDDFTQPESIFNVYRAADADNFYLALKAWDNRLRTARTGGDADISSRISLREDILGFSDVVWNPVRQRFETNPDQAALDLNMRRFRAFLLRNVQPPTSRYSLRLEFPLTYGQLSRRTIGATLSQQAVIRASRSDWNIRVKELSATIWGQNIAQEGFNQLRLELIQYGKLEIPRYHPRNPEVYPNFLTFNLPLYYEDPERALINAFKFSLNAGLNSNGELNAFIAQVEPTPFCDRYVLLVERDANPPINFENIRDIEFTVRSRSSIPPVFGL